jgi:two-component system, cell cycle response regulator DivK
LSSRILIVDDNTANLRLAEFLLTSGGLETRTAESAVQALQTLQTFVPDIILMDLQLPGMDGLTLTRQLKQDPATRHIRIVAMTAYAMIGDAERARAAGCDGYLSKPIDPGTFIDSVLRYLIPREPQPVS